MKKPKCQYYLDGNDSLLLIARSKMPEPSRWLCDRYDVKIEEVRPYPQFVGFNYDFKSNRPASIRIEVFRKHLLSGPGIQFYAWVADKDGKVYI